MTKDEVRNAFLRLLKAKNLLADESIVPGWLAKLYDGTDMQTAQLQAVYDDLLKEGILAKRGGITSITDKGVAALSKFG